jgi:hypothetical protein
MVSVQDHPVSPSMHEVDASFNNTLKHVQTPTLVEEITTRFAVEMAKVVAGSLKTMYWFSDEKYIGMLTGAHVNPNIDPQHKDEAIQPISFCVRVSALGASQKATGSISSSLVS